MNDHIKSKLQLTMLVWLKHTSKLIAKTDNLMEHNTFIIQHDLILITFTTNNQT